MKARTLAMAALLAGFAASASDTTGYSDACDGSAIAPAGEGHFWNASDDDNTIRLYAIGHAPPVREHDLTAFLTPELSKRGDPKEVDIEAVARIGTRLYWIGSHGNDRNGHRETSRERLFATEMRHRGAASTLEPVGTPFRGLRGALLRLPGATGAALVAAAPKAPESGGLNIEGLAATAQGLLIGLRSPLVDGRAIVLPLVNASAVVERGVPPAIGAPWLLDLGGRGVRAIESTGSVPDEYWVLAGATGSGGTFALYRWRLGASPQAVPSAALRGSLRGSPEGLMRSDDGHLLASLDGGDLDGCKSAAPPARRFRVLRID